jgi:hypothetical protein
MTQQAVMQGWRVWLESHGLPEHQIEWFLESYSRCRFLEASYDQATDIRR